MSTSMTTTPKFATVASRGTQSPKVVFTPTMLASLVEFLIRRERRSIGRSYNTTIVVPTTHTTTTEEKATSIRN